MGSEPDVPTSAHLRRRRVVHRNGLGRYPEGTNWHVIKLIELRGERITSVTSYFAPSFPARDRRADLTEPWDAQAG